jgi:hypothetical protein
VKPPIQLQLPFAMPRRPRDVLLAEAEACRQLLAVDQEISRLVFAAMMPALTPGQVAAIKRKERAMRLEKKRLCGVIRATLRMGPHFVRLTGAALATTTAAGTAVAAPAGTDTDAELMAVGEQLLKLYERRAAVDAIAAPQIREYWERLQTAFDDAGDVIKEARRKGGVEAANRLVRIHDAAIRQQLGPDFDRISQEQNDLTDALDQPARRMFALPAHTISGLALKAVLAAYENTQLWQSALDDLEWNERFLRHLIEAVLATAGTPLPFATPVVGHAPHPDELEPLDPIFAAIEKHREAMKAFHAAPSDNAASDAEIAVHADLIATVPSTFAGTLAVLRYVTAYQHDGGGIVDGPFTLFDDAEEESFTFLKTIGDAIEAAMRA